MSEQKPGSRTAPLVIRFGRLGDLVLTWPALAALHERSGPVSLVTSRRYAGLMGALPWVGRTFTLEGQAGVAGLQENLALAGEIRAAGFGPIIDLHGSLRSRILVGRLGGAARTVAKDSLDRRLTLGIRLGDGRLRAERGGIREFTRRFLDAVDAPADVPAVPRAPAELCDTPIRGDGPLLALLPGARSETKRWPAPSYAALASSWRAATGGRSTVFYGPGEETLARDVVDGSDGAAVPHDELDLLDLLRGMGRCAVAVGGDTGLLHLAGAAGARPVGLFGPTGANMGYWPWESIGTAVVPDLPCHPCTLYGSRRCPLDHHACLQELEVDDVLQVAVALLETDPHR